MQRAKAFFYVCAGLFLLAVSYHFGARGAQAQGSSVAQEVAVLSGSVPDGGTIPLPHYQDGSEALESDCRWMVSQGILEPGYPSVPPQFTRCSTEGRLVHMYWCPDNCGPVGDCGQRILGCPVYRGSANYLIIATRVNAPIPTRPNTIGQLKARFREPRPAGR